MKIKQYKSNKECELTDFKVLKNADGSLQISGYANTKHVADRYGDIPTEFNRSYVYDVNEFLKNPIMLVSHNSDISHVAGSFTKVQEDERGLYVEGTITNSDLPLMKHLRTLIEEKHIKTFSIGGEWIFEDLQNPDHLTLAKIYEISIVAVPADPNATFEPVEEPAKTAPDYSALGKKIAVFEMKQKLKDFEVKNNKPALSGKEQ